MLTSRFARRGSAAFIRAGLRVRPAAMAPAKRPGWLRSMGQGGREAVHSREVRILVPLTWLMAIITVYEGLAAPYADMLGGDARRRVAARQ